MYNPHCLLSEALLEAFVDAGKKYFVRQSLPETERTPPLKGSFLITHYDKMGETLQHFEAIAHDRYKRIYHWLDPADRKKLQLAASQPEGYKVYAAVVMPGWEKHADQVLRKRIMNYADQNFKWQTSGKDSVSFVLYPHFGEVFVRMRFRKQEIKVSLAEIEKSAEHVLRRKL